MAVSTLSFIGVGIDLATIFNRSPDYVVKVMDTFCFRKFEFTKIILHSYIYH